MGKETRGDVPEPRKGQDDVHLTREEFTHRFRQSFYDPAFDGLQQEIERLAAAAWDGYEHSRKSPRTRKAGAAFSDPDYDLSVEWLAAREAIEAAARRQLDPTSASH
jgi:hypothetical protein